MKKDMPRSQDKRDRPITLRLPIVTEVLLALWGHARERSVTAMAEAIVTDRAEREDRRLQIWQAICRLAELNNMTANAYITQYLKQTGDFDFLDLESIDWGIVLLDKEKKDDQDEY